MRAVKGLAKLLVPKRVLAARRDRRQEEERSSGFQEALFRRHARKTFGDQKGQVDFLINSVLDYEHCGLHRDGVFVDLAAADGVVGSNTLFLERYLGWSGVLIEANPRYHDKLRANRTSPIVTECISETSGETVQFRVDNNQRSGIVAPDTDNSPQLACRSVRRPEVITLSTVTLADVLEQERVPKTIDFLSLDIEGAEYRALKNFPFDKYKFRCMTIERPTPPLDILLDSNGYVQVCHLLWDVMYVHRDYLPAVNLSPRLRFAFTLAKPDAARR